MSWAAGPGKKKGYVQEDLLRATTLSAASRRGVWFGECYRVQKRQPDF